jgi:hypothetical protein
VRTTIDIVSQNGLEWIKVSLLTEKRLISEMAEKGWQYGTDSEEDEDEDESLNDSSNESDADDVSLVRIAKVLVKEAGKLRVRYKHPLVRLVLPNIRSGSVKEIDKLLDQIRSLGAVVQTKGEIAEEVPLKSVVKNLLRDETSEFSEVLNIDCTILLALVSDISHGTFQPEHNLDPALKQQIKMEKVKSLLADTLYPVLRGHELVCTKIAATHMREMVAVIGTNSEKARTAALLTQSKDRTREQVLNDFSQSSSHELPRNMGFPIKIVPYDVDVSKLPPVVAAVESKLDHVVSKSVFLYGWSTGRTTITANGVAARKIESVIEKMRTSDSQVGPDIWLCQTPRSLIGKESRARQERIVYDSDS